MLAIAMLLLTAAPVADPVHVRHPARVVRTVRVVRPVRKTRRPITMSLKKFRPDNGCGTSSICVTAQARSPYRLPLPSTAEPTDKDMALAEDGTRCALIGQTICTHPATKIVQIGEPAPAVPAEAVLK
ncbi:MAG: hypothetical protein JWN66_249 [Sphingomonas bacterium]|uniref:hypothetical protein n=1 Tax=Sphingomonas bacterium TaxID=1895847 RepID=UPI0026158FBA|nr:hypothetical protein [Sphingomonas bacterium]MDB5703133.1 hypothetical protein [Sphingomonas bacterium]